MKIVHLCLSCFYIDGFSYQENEIVRQHVAEGHDVTVITSTENYRKDNHLVYVQPSTYIGNEGAKVIRLRYKKLLPHNIMKKLRMHDGVYALLNDEKPDAVMFHGLCGWELINTSKYCSENPRVKFYVDSHEDFNNSARTFVSKNLLHRFYYKSIIKYCLKNIPKILCISLETIEFVANFYQVPRNKLEFFPLGGDIFDDKEYNLRRDIARNELLLREDTILCLQTGKFGRRKKLIESIKAFNQVSTENMMLVLAGVIDVEIKDEVTSLIEDNKRVELFGWKNSEEIKNLLCGADLYIQPGTQSATMQMSLCARCPVILDDVLSHEPFINGNGWLINEHNTLESILDEINIEKLKMMSKASYRIAKKLLDYKELSARVLR